jgi:hypothetical protein
VLRVLDAEKKPCKESIIDLAKTAKDANDKPYRIHEVHSSGAFGVDIEAYRSKGLVIPADL